MTIITIKDNKILSASCDVITTGSVNFNYVTFKFSGQWDTLIKIATFKVETQKISVPIENNSCVIPWELLALKNAGKTLSLGVVGSKTENFVGEAVYNTESGLWYIPSGSAFYFTFLNLKTGDSLEIGNQIGWEEPMTQGVIGSLNKAPNGIYFGLLNQTGTLINNATANFGFNYNTTVISTPYSDLGKILLGADGSSQFSINPSPSAINKIISDIGRLTDLTTENKNNLVSAINEVNSKSDKHFVYKQRVASSLWKIVHNLDKHPSVTVVDSAGTTVYGEVDYTTTNSVQIRFMSAFSGTAYLN